MSDRVSEMREIIDRHAYPALTFTSCEQLHRALIARIESAAALKARTT